LDERQLQQNADKTFCRKFGRSLGYFTVGIPEYSGPQCEGVDFFHNIITFWFKLCKSKK
jgi:hypothetical protein